MKNIPLREWLLVAAILAVGLFLRLKDLEAFRLSPDDGQYMHSARLHVLERSLSPARWLREDKAWIGELSADIGRWKDRTTYQHSYLHQFLARCGYRLGLDRIEALRLDSAILGTLTALFLYLFYAHFFPERRSVGLIAAAILSVLLFHVFFSRTGWGQIGCTAFWFLMFGVGFQIFARMEEDDPARLRRFGMLLALASVLAYGFQEMISVYVVAMAIIALLSVNWRRAQDRERGIAAAWVNESWFGRVLHSRRVGTFALAALPVGLMTLGLACFSDYARHKWFSPDIYNFTYLEARRLTLQRWFTVSHVERQISWPVLALLPAGLVALWRRDRFYFKYVAAWILIPSGIFFFVFNDPSLERIYLPAVVLLVVLAAECIAFIGGELGERAARLVPMAATTALCAYLGLVTWFTLFGPVDHPLFEAGPYVGIVESRHSEETILQHLREHAGGETIGLSDEGEKSPIFFLLDAGLKARMFSFNEPEGEWPRYIVGGVKIMEGNHRTLETGGKYHLVTQDKAGRTGLYERT